MKHPPPTPPWDRLTQAKGETVLDFVLRKIRACGKWGKAHDAKVHAALSTCRYIDLNIGPKAAEAFYWAEKARIYREYPDIPNAA